MKLKVILICALGLTQKLNATDEIPKSMAAIGDSISAGALAGFTRTDARNPLALPTFLFYLGKIGYMRSLHAMEEKKNSWATGTGSRVLTHARRLNALAPSNKMKIYNASVSGANSDDINSQVDAVLKWSESFGQGSPDYVTIEIGANDACARSNEGMTPTSRYTNNLKNAVYKLMSANRQAKILIGGIPNLEHLRNVAENSTLTGLPPTSKCKNIWALHKFCNNMLLEKDVAKRKEISQRILDYSTETAKMVAEANVLFGKDRVRFVPQVYEYKFNDKEISIDCFHPGPQGHQAISDVTWQYSWWADRMETN